MEVNIFVLVFCFQFLFDTITAGFSSLRYCYSYCDATGYYRPAITCNSALTFCCYNAHRRSKYCCSDLSYMIPASLNEKGILKTSCEKSGSFTFIPSWTWITGGTFLLFFLIIIVILRRYRARRIMQRAREMAESNQAAGDQTGRACSYPAQINPSFVPPPTGGYTISGTGQQWQSPPYPPYPPHPQCPSTADSNNTPDIVYNIPPSGPVPSLPAYTTVDTPPPSYETIYPPGGTVPPDKNN